MLGLSGFAGLILVWGAVYGLSLWLHRRGVLRHDLYRDWLAVGVLALAVAAFFWPLLFTESWIPKGGGDLASFIYPIYAFAARWLKRGVIPLWNPHLYMGMPFAADNQSGLFYPVNLVFFFFTSPLTYQVVEWMAVTHVFLAGLFTYVLIRDLPSPRLVSFQERPHRVGRMAAVAGAVAYMLSDLFVVHLGNLNIIATAAWLPLALFCFRRALVRRGWGWVGWSGVVLGIAALVGHAQMFLYVGMALGLYTLFEWYLRRQDGIKVAMLLFGKLLLTGGIAFGLAALSLIPAFDLPQYTVRASLSYAEASDFAIPPAGLVGLILPGFFGRGTGPFWGPWSRTEMGYVGVLPLMLAAIAVVLTLRRRPLVRFWLVLAGVGLLTALGGYAALHGWTFALLPFFRQLRVPARAIFLFDFAVAVLAAEGLDLLLHPITRRARRSLRGINRAFGWIGAALALVGVPLLGHAVLVSRSLAQDVLTQLASSMGSLIFFLLLFGAGIGWLALRRHRLARRVTLGVMAVCLIAFDLISLGAYVEIEPNTPLAGYKPDKALAFLQSAPGVFRVELAPGAPVGWSPDWALIHEMDDWGGIWNPLRLGAYNVLTWVGIDREMRFYDLYNIQYLVAYKDAGSSLPERMEPVFEHRDTVIYLDPRALPRAFMVYKAQVVQGPMDALHAGRSSDFDPAQLVVLDREAAAAAMPLDVDPGDGERSVEILDRGPNHLDFRVVTPVEGYLVVSEMWMPDWAAYVDGEKQAVARANFTFRAVHVPAGTHEVHMVYQPRSWYVGVGITLSTVVGLFLWGVVAVVRRQRKKNEP